MHLLVTNLIYGGIRLHQITDHPRGQHRQPRNEPHERNRRRRTPLRDPRFQRPHDHHVLVYADGYQCIRTNQHGETLRIAGDCAQKHPEGPILFEYGDCGERDAKDRDEKLPHGEVRYEVICDGSHPGRGEHYVADEAVAHHGHHEDDGVDRVDGAAEIGRFDRIVRG